MPVHPATKRIPITCARCSQGFDQPFLWLKENRKFLCPHCDARVVVEGAKIKAAMRAGV